MRKPNSPLLSAIRTVMQGHVQKTLAAKMRISQQYLSELLNGRKDWSPELVDSLIDAINRDWIDRAKLHRLGARAQGWKIP